MRAAPAVIHPLAGTGPWLWAGVLLAVAAAGTPVAWLGWHLHTARLADPAESATLGALGLLAGVLAGVLAWRRCHRRHAEQLRWDGGRWQLLDGKGHAWLVSAPAVAMDLGPWMLLHTRRALDGSAAWLPMQRASAPASWHGLRAALAQPQPAKVHVTGVAV